MLSMYCPCMHIFSTHFLSFTLILLMSLVLSLHFVCTLLYSSLFKIGPSPLVDESCVQQTALLPVLSMKKVFKYEVFPRHVVKSSY